MTTLLFTAGLGLIAIHNLLAWAKFALGRAFEGDFGLYYAFARIGLRQGFHQLYDLAAQRREWDALGPLLWYPAPYPPFLAWLVAPFALLPFPLAYGLWNVVLAAALVGTWLLLAPGGRSLRALQLALALALPVVAFSLLLGQVVLIVAFALALAARLLVRGSATAAGLTLCLIAVKPQLALLVPVALLAAGRLRVFLTWGVATGGLLLLAWWSLGLDGLTAYAHRLRDATGALGAYQVPAGLTLPGLLGHGLPATVAQAMVVAAVVVAAWRRRGRGPMWTIAIGVVGSLLFTPFYHSDDLAVLVPAAWMWMRTAPPAWERVPMAVGMAAAILLATPLPLLASLLGSILAPDDLLYLTGRRDRRPALRLPGPQPGTTVIGGL